MAKLIIVYKNYFLMLLIVSLASCAGNIVKKRNMSIIPGLWRTEKVKENFKITDDYLKSAVEDAQNTIYLFNENNTAEIRVRNISNKAEWSLEGDWLILKREGDELKFRLLKITNKSMTLAIKYPDGELTYFLSRINTVSH